MADIFISHATDDKALADKFVSFLKEAIGVPAKSIFCSSISGHNVPLTVDFNAYMKDKIQAPKLVVAIMSPRYMESWFCLMELGAAWSMTLHTLPVVVPPTNFGVVTSTLGLKQAWSIDNHEKLIELRQLIQGLGIGLEPRTEQDWEKKRKIWQSDLKKLLKELKLASTVSAAEHSKVQEQLAAAQKECAEFEELYQEEKALSEGLKKIKEPRAVKALMKIHGGVDPQAEFDAFLEGVSNARPSGISIYFYRHILMDHYGKAPPIQWNDSDMKEGMDRAIQTNIADVDAPHQFLWAGTKLKKVSAAIKALEEFIDGPDGADFAKQMAHDGTPMEYNDLEFWEYHLI